jgi:cytochrome c-type biogenesis protein CcmE
VPHKKINLVTKMKTILSIVCFVGLAASLRLENLRDEYSSLGTKIDLYEEEHQAGTIILQKKIMYQF